MDINVSIELAPLARQLGLPEPQLRRTVELLDEGNTVPFITRYRKDQTGGLDEEQIRQIHDAVTRGRMLVERKRTILKSIESQGKLTEELAEKIRTATSTKRLEDLYLPFKPKKQTLATIARERGLEPLAREIVGGDAKAIDLDARAKDFIDSDKGLKSQADVLLGVGHLIAEQFSERADLREALRKIVRTSGKIVGSKIAVPEDEKPKAALAESEFAEEAESVEAALTPADHVDEVHDETHEDAHEESPTDEEIDAEREVEAAEGDGSSEPEAMPAAASPEPPPSADIQGEAENNVALPSELVGGEAVGGAPESAAEDLVQQAAERKILDQQAAKREAQLKKEAARQERKARKEEEKRRKRKQKEAAFKDYFKFQESITKLPPHRILAINRGERARVLRVKLEADLDAMRKEAETIAVPAEHPHADFLRGCLKDALNRLIFPAMEREVRRELTDKAEEHAVAVFARNLRKLLLTPPVSGHRVLAIDPGFRSGCKLAALDEFGNLHGHGMIYLVGNEERLKRSRARFIEMIRMHKITAVAIGNGTACRESEKLVADVLASELKDEQLAYVIVNEAGASVYSTSPVGREELGQYDAAQRSAVSIGRRLLDPLSELVKINPANIGVGLYQHDMKAKHLQDSLDAVVESCVNFVGVDLNTASPSLLRYVSGLNQLTARRLYEYRQQHGPFERREQLRDVPGIGEATFVQAAGFLKITGGDNPLDATWIHPESYEAAKQVLGKLDAGVEDVARQVNTSDAANRRKAKTFAEGLHPPATHVAEVTATPVETSIEVTPDTAVAVDAPLQAPEAPASEPVAEGNTEPVVTDDVSTVPAVLSTEYSVLAAESPAAATEEDVADKAAREAARKLAEKASQVNAAQLAGELQIGELLCRDILNSLTRPGRDPREDLPPPLFRREILKLEDLKPGMQLAGTVLNVVDFGAFVDIGLHDTGLVHISRLADRYIKDPHEVVGVGDTLHVWVMEVDRQRRRVSLTAIRPGTEKQAQPRRERQPRPKRDDQPQGEKRPPRPPRPQGQGRPQGPSRPQPAQAGKEGQQSQRSDRPRRDDKDRGKRGGGRPGGGRGDKHAPRSGPAQPFTLESKKPVVVKLTKAMKEGKAPLRTFGDLAAFIKTHDELPPPPPPAEPVAEVLTETPSDAAPPETQLPPGESQ